MRATTPLASASVGSEGAPLEQRETGWRSFLNSWQLGAILAVALVVGVLAIVTAHPFSGRGVSEQVSDSIGQPASCDAVGAVQVAGGNSTIYRCIVGLEKHRLAQCFTITSGEVRQLIGTRSLGC
jgi:hypothetical protein